LAIDPFLEMDDIRHEFLTNLRIGMLNERVQLMDNYNLVVDKGFSLIHIDGEHTERAVLNDLEFAQKNLGVGGVIVVDDIWQSHFLGVMSAVMKIVHNSDLVPFLTTRNKMYLTREKDYNFNFAKAKNLLLANAIPFSVGFAKGDAINGFVTTYKQENSIKGFPQIVVEGKNRYEQLIVLGIIPNQPNNIFTRSMRNIMPPILFKISKSLYLRVVQLLHLGRFCD
jgi:hypothetical protein